MASDLLKDLETAASEGQAHEFRDVMHGLRGSAVNIGAMKLYQLLLSYRNIGAAEIGKHSALYIGQITKEFAALRAELTEYLGDSQGEELPS